MERYWWWSPTRHMNRYSMIDLLLECLKSPRILKKCWSGTHNDISSMLYHFLNKDADNFIWARVTDKRMREIGLVVPAIYGAYSKNQKDAIIFDRELANFWSWYEIKRERKIVCIFSRLRYVLLMNSSSCGEVVLRFLFCWQLSTNWDMGDCISHHVFKLYSSKHLPSAGTYFLISAPSRGGGGGL